MVNNKTELLSAIAEHRSEIQSYGVQKLGIFGSFARNEVKPDSDVDLLVEIQPQMKTLSNLVHLAGFLTALFQRKVELVTPQSLNSRIGKYILDEVQYVSFAG